MLDREGCRKVVLLVFHRSSLLYDIKNYAFVQGDVMKVSNEHERHQVMDVGEEGNVDRVTRVLNLAYQECVDMLYSYTKSDLADESSLDDMFEESEMYKMKLLLPESFNKGTVELLRNLIHEYMVYRVLADWMSIINWDAESVWNMKAEEMKEKIMACLNTRMRRVRRGLTPF